jgi:Neutral/alkaline non-lysosomal ceramidase, N-terminal
MQSTRNFCTSPGSHAPSGLRLFAALLFCCLSLPGVFQESLAEASDLRAGVARVDITPSQPVKMGGYESRKEPSHGIHDPLGARALALEADGEHLVLVSIDNLGFYNNTAEPLRQGILEACHLKPAELFLCAIHTHSAPILTLDPETGGIANVEYTKTLRAKLIEVVSVALKRLERVQGSVSFGSSPVGVNRREVIEQGTENAKVVLGRNPWRTTDREVQVLKLVAGNGGTTIGALFAYATHSTSLGAKSYLISGDVHGIAEQFLEHYYGHDFVAPGFAGASGNIDPWVRVLPEFRTNNGWIPEPILLGTLLGEEVARVLEGPQAALNNNTIRSQFKTVFLPGKQPSGSQSTSSSPASINLTVGHLGDVAFVGWGGEVFNEIGLAVKKESPFRHTFILTHCIGAAGYLPTHESYSEGGYEVGSSKFGRGAAEALADETLRMLRNLHEE